MRKDKEWNLSGSRKIIIAGAGASGMCAAIAAAREGAEVTIIEKTDCCGKKLSMTGNGRCNLSNLDISEADYNEVARGRMKTWLKRFGVKETLDFFSSLGLVVSDESGYLYPISGQASTVVDILQSECKRLSVNFIFKEQVKSIDSHDDSISFTVKTDKNDYEADRVILATGGLAGPKSCGATGDGYYICEKLGMEQKNTYPALTPLLSDDDTLPKDSGVRCMAIVTFLIGDGAFASEYGEVQITKNGISGIPVLQASGLVAYHLSKNRPVTASINFFPGYDLTEYEALIDQMMDLPGERTLGDLLTGF
ncbi:MAG: aminoacetone oxidase family FAD-binding enzyme, partial [Butyrivibrio sp.]|nr:aminoacetone oxidase family FAD-binding enzyme [Butyrivibrio sp.]